MPAFYMNLKKVLEEKNNMSTYKASQLTGLSIQTIEYQIKNKVKNPKEKTLKALASGLNVSVSRLLYGADYFNLKRFYYILEKRGVTFDELIIETGADPCVLLKGEFPKKRHQEKIAKYLRVDARKIFVPSRPPKDYMKTEPYSQPDMKSEPSTDDMVKLYKNLSPTAKKLIYNFAYNLATIEVNYVLSINQIDYWKK